MTIRALVAVFVPALIGGCGLDERAVTVATGGAGGHGGVGPGGAAGTTLLAPCSGIPVRADLITDFSDAYLEMNAVSFGSGGEQLGGGSYTYSAPGLATPVLSLEPRGTDQALRVVIDPGVPVSAAARYLGFGFGLGYVEGNCLDASAYAGVRFTVEGSVGTCALSFGVQFSQDTDVITNPSGACALGTRCYPPRAPVTVAGTVTVAFADLTGGSPVDRLDRRTITTVEWALEAPSTGTPCSGSFTVDDVTFVR